MTTPQTPSAAGANGRTESGRFAKGNRAGRGNPHAKRAQLLRSAVLDAVGPDDIAAVVAKLVTMAKGGDVAAIKLLFDRVLGKLPAAVADPDEPGDGKPDLRQQAETMLLSMKGASNVG